MVIITTLRRFASAILTAVGVVLGLTPDPTRTPILVPEREERVVLRRKA